MAALVVGLQMAPARVPASAPSTTPAPVDAAALLPALPAIAPAKVERPANAALFELTLSNRAEGNLERLLSDAGANRDDDDRDHQRRDDPDRNVGFDPFGFSRLDSFC